MQARWAVCVGRNIERDGRYRISGGRPTIGISGGRPTIGISGGRPTIGISDGRPTSEIPG